jgi:hypothetical protein
VGHVHRGHHLRDAARQRHAVRLLHGQLHCDRCGPQRQRLERQLRSGGRWRRLQL